MKRRTQLAGLPQVTMADRRVTLRRVLADLPDPLLAALISGLELHGDNLCFGRLYRSHDQSCAAGAMIRQLNPDEFARGRVRFWLHHRWRKGVASYGGDLRAGMHAQMIEATFDRAVGVTLKACPGARGREASRLVGGWFLEEAERELQIRDDRRAVGLPAVVSWREQRLRRWGEGMDRRMPRQPDIEVADDSLRVPELTCT